MFKQGQKLPPTGGNMQGFLWTPCNATSRTTGQDALWHHILDRNRSSQPFMTPCARQFMNRIPGNVTPPWAGCWGPPHSCSMSGAIYLPAQRNRQPARPTPRPRPPPHPGKATPCPVWHVTFARNMESSPHWRFLRFPVARRGRCNSGISSRLAQHKSRVLLPPIEDSMNMWTTSPRSDNDNGELCDVTDW